MRCIDCGKEFGTDTGTISELCAECRAASYEVFSSDNTIIEKVIKCPECGYEIRERVR
jgi:DNA-directed RNA polymerase subunit RPC12/RpoP